MDWTEEIPINLLEWSYTAPEAQPFGANLKNIGVWEKEEIIVLPEQHEVMWSHLEAIVHAARHAKRVDLLLDLPADLARRLGLVFRFELPSGQVSSLGSDQGQAGMSWDSFLRLCRESTKERELSLVGDLVEVFGVVPEFGGENIFCTACGSFASAFVETVDGCFYCRGCWSELLRASKVSSPNKRPVTLDPQKKANHDKFSVGSVRRRQLSIPGFPSGAG